MAERERRLTPPFGGVFVARTRVMSAEDVDRATWRMAHEIIERTQRLFNGGCIVEAVDLVEVDVIALQAA